MEQIKFEFYPLLFFFFLKKGAAACASIDADNHLYCKVSNNLTNKIYNWMHPCGKTHIASPPSISVEPSPHYHFHVVASIGQKTPVPLHVEVSTTYEPNGKPPLFLLSATICIHGHKVHSYDPAWREWMSIFCVNTENKIMQHMQHKWTGITWFCFILSISLLEKKMVRKKSSVKGDLYMA